LRLSLRQYKGLAPPRQAGTGYRLAGSASRPYLLGMRRRLMAILWILCALTLPAGVVLESLCRVAMPAHDQIAMTDDHAAHHGDPDPHEHRNAPSPACCHAFTAQFVGLPSRDDPGGSAPAATPAVYFTSDHRLQGLPIIPALGPPRSAA